MRLVMLCIHSLYMDEEDKRKKINLIKNMF